MVRFISHTCPFHYKSPGTLLCNTTLAYHLHTHTHTHTQVCIQCWLSRKYFRYAKNAITFVVDIVQQVVVNLPLMHDSQSFSITFLSHSLSNYRQDCTRCCWSYCSRYVFSSSQCWCYSDVCLWTGPVLQRRRDIQP